MSASAPLQSPSSGPGAAALPRSASPAPQPGTGRSPASRTTPQQRRRSAAAAAAAEQNDGEDFEKVVDYFAVVGPRPHGDLELLDEEQTTPDMLRCVWEASITDIAVVRPSKGEICPDGYELIERTPNNHKADLNHGSMQRAVFLAVQRQHVSRRTDYIADVQVLFTQYERLPVTEPGWELITRSVSGKKAKLNKGGDHAYLAVRRVARDALDCPPAVVNVCVVLKNKDEAAPHGWHLLERDLNKGKFGDVVYLAYELGPPFSIARLPYRSEILDRYPEVDNPVFPFPQDQLPMFIYPKGMLLEHREVHDTPKPTFFSFVFTNVDGRRTYAACLTFYEPLLPSDVRRLNHRLGLSALDECSSSATISRRNTGEAVQQRRRTNSYSSLPQNAAANSASSAGNLSVNASNSSNIGGGGGALGGNNNSSNNGSYPNMAQNAVDGAGQAREVLGVTSEDGGLSANSSNSGSVTNNELGGNAAASSSADGISQSQPELSGSAITISGLNGEDNALNVAAAAGKAEEAGTACATTGSAPKGSSSSSSTANIGLAPNSSGTAENSGVAPNDSSSSSLSITALDQLGARIVEQSEPFGRNDTTTATLAAAAAVLSAVNSPERTAGDIDQVALNQGLWRDEGDDLPPSNVPESGILALGGGSSGGGSKSFPRLHRRTASNSGSAVDTSWRLAAAGSRGGGGSGGVRRSGSHAGVALAAAAAAQAEEMARVAAGDAESRAAAYEELGSFNAKTSHGGSMDLGLSFDAPVAQQQQQQQQQQQHQSFEQQQQQQLEAADNNENSHNHGSVGYDSVATRERSEINPSTAEEEGWDAAVLQGGGRDLLFAPKTICVISRFPIYGVMRRFLRHLYAISLSETQVPLERYISMFVSCIPMPAPGGRHFHVYLEPLESGDPRRSRLKPLNLFMPPYPWLPLMDMDFSAPFRCLSIDSVLCIFSLMLQEAKILFLSSRAELLTQVMEAMRSLIFPLDWQSVYVPRLPYALSGCLECPGGFLIGMHMTRAEMAAGTASLTRDLGLRGVANAVNLDIGEIILSSGEVAGCLFPNDPRSYLHSPLPGTGEAALAKTRREDGTHAGGSGGGTSGFLTWLGGCGCAGNSNSSLNGAYGAYSGDEGVNVSRRRVAKSAEANSDGSNINNNNNSSGKGASGKGSGGGGGSKRDGCGDDELPISSLPEPLRSEICARLSRELFDKCDVRVGREDDLDQYESAFEFAPVPDLSDVAQEMGPRWRPAFAAWIKAATQPGGLSNSYSSHFHSSTNVRASNRGGGNNNNNANAFGAPLNIGEFEANLVVRDAFVCCMAELLGGIGSFVRRSEVKRSRHSLRTRPLDELFNMGDFLAGLSPPVRPFVEKLTATQMFWVLVQQWLESSEKDEQLVFFEECVMALKSRRAGGVIPYRDDAGTGSNRVNRANTEADDPIPLVDEVRLKRPDLYGYAPSHPPRLGNVATPLATPSASSKLVAEATALANGFGPGVNTDINSELNPENHIDLENASLASSTTNTNTTYAPDSPLPLPLPPLQTTAKGEEIVRSSEFLAAAAASSGGAAAGGGEAGTLRSPSTAPETSSLSPLQRRKNNNPAISNTRHVAFAAANSRSSDFNCDGGEAHLPGGDSHAQQQRQQFPQNGLSNNSASSMAAATLLSRLDSAYLEAELQLMDNGAAPVIIPGPAVDPNSRGSELISYADGWPTPLDKELLKMPAGALPPIVLKLQSFSAMHRRIHSRRQPVQGAPIGTRLMYGEFEPMVVVPLEAFKAAKAIPRSSEAARTGALVSYASLKSKRRQAVVLFVSHRWLQPRALPPHPDQGSVTHALLCAGVDKLLQGVPPQTKAYLWIDFSCIDQDDMKRRRRGIRSLPSYIERCDAMIIPYTAEGAVGSAGRSIVPNSGGAAELDLSGAPASVGSNNHYASCAGGQIALGPQTSPVTHDEHIGFGEPNHSTAGKTGIFSESGRSFLNPAPLQDSAHVNPGFSGTASSALSGGQAVGAAAGVAGTSENPFAGAWDNGWPARYPSLAQYASRAWCRAELYMASNIPILPDGLFYFDVANMAHRSGDRPVFLFGPEQFARDSAPAVLPRLDKSWFRRVNPVEGFLTQESDRREIFALLERVQCATPAPPKPGYKGQQRLWRPHGKGKMVFGDGRVYEGNWRNGKMSGQGVMHYSRGSRYDGEWRGGKKDGKGNMTYPDGARYDGQWVDGRRKGMGTYVYASGAVYEGEWEDGKMHGSGCYTSASGSRYQGKYVRGKRHGHGTMEYGDGRTYVGEWKGGVRNGEGTYFLADGGRFEGIFRRDKKQGKGRLYLADGTCIEQEWSEGRLCKEEAHRELEHAGLTEHDDLNNAGLTEHHNVLNNGGSNTGIDAVAAAAAAAAAAAGLDHCREEGAQPAAGGLVNAAATSGVANVNYSAGSARMDAAAAGNGTSGRRSQSQAGVNAGAAAAAAGSSLSTKGGTGAAKRGHSNTAAAAGGLRSFVLDDEDVERQGTP